MRRWQSWLWAVFTTASVILLGLAGQDVGKAFVDFMQTNQITKKWWSGGPYAAAVSQSGFVLLGVLLGWLVGTSVSHRVSDLLVRMERISVGEKLAALVGVLVGLVLTYLLLFPILSPNIFGGKMPEVATLLIIVFVAAVSIYLCLRVMEGARQEIIRFFPKLALLWGSADEQAEAPAPTDSQVKPKLLDTNVIIDGRLADICKSGFIEGTLYVPQFVLNELQKIADSEDSLKRARGKRGLQVLEQMQQDPTVNIKILSDYNPDVERSPSVDFKLVRLAQEMGAVIVTNDHNLHRIAQLQGVPVLNVNELATALKPVVLPGEELVVTIVKEGKEPGQGVGYLDDGTMVVVEDGKKHIGERIVVTVSSLLQTVAGKMIFAETKEELAHAEEDLFKEYDSGRSRRRTGKTN